MQDLPNISIKDREASENDIQLGLNFRLIRFFFSSVAETACAALALSDIASVIKEHTRIYSAQVSYDVIPVCGF